MNFETLRETYVKNGFVWTSHLEEFIRENAGAVLKYPHFKTNKMVEARLCRPDLISLGRMYGEYQGAFEYLHEEVAPVGDCNNGHIYLLLTERGTLLGVADYMLLSWGEGAENDWRKSLKALLLGLEPTCVTVLDSD